MCSIYMSNLSDWLVMSVAESHKEDKEAAHLHVVMQWSGSNQLQNWAIAVLGHSTF